MTISVIPFPNLCVLSANPFRPGKSTRANLAKDAKVKGINPDEIARTVQGTGPNGTKLRSLWDVSGAGFFGGSGGGFEENFLSDEAHFAQNGFQSAMFGNGLLEELGLVCGEGYTDRPRIDLARPSPVAWVVGRHAAVGNPFQGTQLLFEGTVTAH